MSGYSGTHNEAAGQQDYVRALFEALRRRWLSTVVGTLLLFGLLGTGVQFLPKIYHGVASVEVLSKTPIVASPDIVTGDQVFTDETAGTELGIFESPELQTAVIRKLGLLNNDEFNPDLKPSYLQDLLLYIEQSSWGNMLPPGLLPVIEPASEGKALFDTVRTFAKKVVVEPVSHSKIIQVTASSRDPVLAAAIANATVAEYISTHQRQKENAYNQAYEFSNLRLPALRADMIAKSAIVNKFRQEHNMVSGRYAAIRREMLTEASKQLIDAQNRLEELKSQEEQSKHGDPMSNPAVLVSATIARLREQQSLIKSEGAGRPTQAPTYAMRALAVEAGIRAEASRIIQSLPSQVAAQEQAVLRQQNEVDRLQAEVSKMDTLQSQLDPLENDALIATKQYTDFLSSDSVSRPDVAFTAVNVRILSSSPVPYRPYSPNNKLMLPVALVLSLLCNCGWTVYRGRRVGFTTAAQLEEAFQIEPIGMIPRRTKTMEQAFWEAVMFLSMKLSPPYTWTKQTILVTSAQPNEGKTTIAVSLAEMFAKRGISVALVDADLRITQKMRRGQKPVIGLRDVLGGAVPLEKATIRQNGVTVVNAGSSSGAHPTSLIASPVMPASLNMLRATHDIVIIDGPPAPIGGDSWALAKLVDRVLCVVRRTETNEQAVQSAFRSLERAPAEIGVVLNMIEPRDDPSVAHMLYYSKYTS